MNWFRRFKQSDQAALDTSLTKMEVVREQRNKAFQRLIHALDEIKIDEGLVKVGDDILKSEKRMG